jgi:glyoxylase-like metal-dependent hydrolase (beta-lactamase superfamily II)
LGIEESGADVELPYRSLFLEVCGRRILIDTGAGPLSPTCGTLAQNLAAVVPLDSIEMVFLTHAHPDHIGGLLLPDGNPAFPNAEVWLSGREWDYWKRLSRDGLLGTGEVFGVPALEELTHQWLERYLFPLENRALRLIGDEVTLAPGVRSFACPGHTPGHMALEIGEHFLYAADLVYRPEQLADLNTATRFDWDREALTASRRTLIAQARQQERPLVFCHVLTEQVPR